MPNEGADDSENGRKRRRRRKRKNRKLEKLMYNLKWMLGGIAVGLPLLAILLYAASRI